MAERCPQAVRVADTFHVVQWATGALDEERRASWNRVRAAAGENESARGVGRPAKDAPRRPDSEKARKLKGLPHCLVEESGELHRQAGSEACLAGEDRSEVGSCLLPEGGSAHRLQVAVRGRGGGVGGVGFVGQALQDSGVREAVEEHCQTP